MKIQLKRTLPEVVNISDVLDTFTEYSNLYQSIDNLKYQDGVFSFDYAGVYNQRLVETLFLQDIEQVFTYLNTYAYDIKYLNIGKRIKAACGKIFIIKEITSKLLLCEDAYSCKDIRFSIVSGDPVGRWIKDYESHFGGITFLVLIKT